MRRKTGTRTIGLVALAIGLGGIQMIGGCASARTTRDPAMLSIERRHTMAMQAAGEGDRLVRQGKNDEAIAKYQEAVAFERELPSVWNNLGETFMRENRHADAVSAFQVAADLAPTDPRPYYNAGLAYQRVGWGEDAMKYYALALERDPGMQRALRGHAFAADMRKYADQKTLEYIKRGLLNETDEQWRGFFERQRFRVEAQLRLESGREG